MTDFDPMTPQEINSHSLMKQTAEIFRDAISAAQKAGRFLDASVSGAAVQAVRSGDPKDMVRAKECVARAEAAGKAAESCILALQEAYGRTQLAVREHLATVPREIGYKP